MKYFIYIFIFNMLLSKYLLLNYRYNNIIHKTYIINRNLKHYI